MANMEKTDIMTIDCDEFDFDDYTAGLENAIENQLKEIKSLKNKLKSASCQINNKQRNLSKENQELHDYCHKLEKETKTSRNDSKLSTVFVSSKPHFKSASTRRMLNYKAGAKNWRAEIGRAHV